MGGITKIGTGKSESESEILINGFDTSNIMAKRYEYLCFANFLLQRKSGWAPT